ncbi:hypothetical protein B296_00040550, partial [Ensete ventricosum]
TTVDSGKKALELLGLLHLFWAFRCLEEGAEDFLLKPVRPSDVSRLCSRIR